ncbi:MAG: ABC transporter ATP-binding protein [Phycisphaera sp.]|nr:MAG: ABC transporter ATP-binding protein [Phycisphaera sp.]
MIRCTGLHKRYSLGERTVCALRGLDLTLDEPGFFAIMGQSGSGKSTLLHLLAAMDTPDEGEIEVAGVRVDQLSEREANAYRRQAIGIIFQQFNLIPTLTAQENVELPGSLAGEPAYQLRERSSALLDRLGVGDRADHRPDALSGGEQQRVAIARALLFSPKVILADEPTGALDSETGQKLWNLLREVAREQGATVLMVTHEPAAAAHCQRVYVLRDGVMDGHIETEGLDAAGVAARYHQRVAQAG